MSMISALIDELNKSADEWNNSNMFELARMSREAADTIWQLRDDLQRTNAEADKLRQELAIREASEQEKVIEYLRRENIDLEDKYRALAVENAKLRMLIDLKQTCWKYIGWCSECPYNGLDDEHDDCNCTVREKVNLLARELGVEVEQ